MTAIEIYDAGREMVGCCCLNVVKIEQMMPQLMKMVESEMEGMRR